MHIGINTSPLKTGHKHRGSGTYIRLLLDALRKYNNEDTFSEFSTLTDLPTNVDCLHFPFFDPFFLTLPAYSYRPHVVTVHDLIPLVYPDHFPPGVRGKIKWQIQKNRLKKIDTIITDSNASRNDIVTILRVPESIINVIPLAADPKFKPLKEQNEWNKVKEKYNLPEEFLLYVGDVNWNKNIPNMLKAVKTIDLPLVLIGRAFLEDEIAEVGEINSIIENERLHAKIIKLGYVEFQELAVIYSYARITLCLSFAEGFGFPVLESMACGTPCVVSNCSSLKEIAGPSITVDPANVDNITKGILKTLKTSKKDQERKVLAWANNYSWKKVAEQTTGVYRKILKQP